MIEIEINGNRRTLDPTSVDELRGYIDGALPANEVICVLRVNGDDTERGDLGTRDLASIRNLEIQTAQPETLARDASPETIEWIGRVAELLCSIGQDFRHGRERRGDPHDACWLLRGEAALYPRRRVARHRHL